MDEFTEKFGMNFANFLELGPHSQPKRKLIDISGEWGHYLYLHKKGLHVGTTIIYIGTNNVWINVRTSTRVSARACLTLCIMKNSKENQKWGKESPEEFKE